MGFTSNVSAKAQDYCEKRRIPGTLTLQEQGPKGPHSAKALALMQKFSQRVLASQPDLVWTGTGDGFDWNTHFRCKNNICTVFIYITVNC